MNVKVKKVAGKAVVVEQDKSVLVELKDFEGDRPKTIRVKPNKPRSK